jgi:hypothetical protein
MARNVGRLSIGIGANTVGLRRGLGSAGRMVGGFKKAIVPGVLAVGALGAAAVGTGFALGTVMVRGQLKAIDASAKFADRIGIGTRELEGLRFSAGLAGAETNNLDLGLQRMTRRIAEAAGGTGEAKAAIAELGLEAAALDRMSPDEQFLAIADAMAKVEGRSQRVRLAFKLFDAEGVGLLNLLDAGSAGLRETIAEAERLGLAFGRVDAAKIEAANDASARLNALWTGFARTLTVEVAPFLETALDRTQSFVAAQGGLGSIVVGTMEGIAVGIGHGVRAAHALEMGGLAIAASFHDAKAAVQGLAGEMTRRTEQMADPTGLLGVDLGSSEAFAAAARDRDAARALRLRSGRLALERGDPVEKARAYFQKIRADATAAAQSVADARMRMNDGDGLAGLDPAAEAQRLAALQREADAVAAALETPAEAFERQAQRLDELRREDVISAEQHARRLAQLAGERDRVMGLAAGGERAGLADDGYDALRAEGEAVRLGVMDAEERFAREVGRLRGLRDQGAIDQSTYVRALQQERGRTLAALNAEAGTRGGGALGGRGEEAFVGRLSRLASTAGTPGRPQEVGGRILERLEELLERIAGRGVVARLEAG